MSDLVTTSITGTDKPHEDPRPKDATVCTPSGPYMSGKDAQGKSSSRSIGWVTPHTDARRTPLMV
jgi:hypothetical protein